MASNMGARVFARQRAAALVRCARASPSAWPEMSLGRSPDYYNPVFQMSNHCRLVLTSAPSPLAAIGLAIPVPWIR